MTHIYDWEVCKKSGKLRHKCKPGDWHIEKHEFRKEPFVTYQYCNVCGFEPPPPPPPPVIPKLDPDVSYQKTGKLVTAFFNKGGLMLKNTLPHFSDQNYRDYIDYIAENNLANCIKMFLYYNENKGVNERVLNMPHPLVNGKYDLHTINPVWFDQVKWRIEYAKERNITLILILNDQNMLDNYNDHWLHPDNNWGWNGKPTWYDHFAWTHWYRYANRPDRTNGDVDCAERYAACEGYILNGLYAKIIPWLDDPLVIWANNEIGAAAMYHSRVAKELAKYGIDRNRMLTSVKGEEWLATKPSIAMNWMPEIHGINTVQIYEDAQTYWPSCPAEPSGDGFGERWDEVGGAEICALLLKSLRDGNLGLTGNTEGEWDQMDWSTAKAMMNTFRGWLEL